MIAHVMCTRRLSFGWFFLFFAVACASRAGGPIKSAESPPSALARETSYSDGCREPVAVTKLPESFSAAGKTCVAHVRAGALAEVLVGLPRAQPLRLALTHSDLEIFPPEQPADLAYVRVASPLRFSGWTRVERYGLVKDSELADGVIHVGKQTTLSNPRVVGDAVIGELSIGGAVAENVRTACGALTTAPPDAPEPELVLGPALVRPRGAWIDISSAVSAATAVRFRNLMALSKLEEKDGLVRVSASYADGSRIAGWAQAAAIETVPAGEEPVPAGTGPGFCGHGCGGGGGEYQVGPAQLLPGTRVHAAPAGEVWAEVPALLRAVVARRGDEPWVRLLRIEGIEEDRGCHSLEHAWVARERVKPLAE